MPVQHGQAPRNVEAAHGDGNASLAERPRDIEGTGILVRLNADQPDHAEIAVPTKTVKKGGHVDTGVRLVDHRDVDGDALTEDLALGAVCCDAVHRGQ